MKSIASLVSTLSCTAVLFGILGGVAHAQDQAASSGGANEIIVTAQKREQSINSVPMMITAVSGDDLVARGIQTTADLEKVVPSFSQSITENGTPVYTLRAVGVYDQSLAQVSPISVYVDEIPLPYAIMTLGAGLDMERVEVLKGPQGLLFGQSATGGAINYIAAKPTSSFMAGADMTYERFGKVDVQGFVSGPLSEKVRARFAGRVVEGGAWQRSLTRAEDRLGDTRQLIGRALLDWDASDRLRLSFAVNGNRNRSDNQAGQLLEVSPFVPATVNPDLYEQPLGDSNRDADWTPGSILRHDDSFIQGSVRADYELSDSVTLTSLTSYAKQVVKQGVDQDATPIKIVDIYITGSVKSFNQEVRLAGATDALTWVVGGNYDRSRIQETDLVTLDGTLSSVPGGSSILTESSQEASDYAFFGNAEYEVSEGLHVQAGLRYNKNKRAQDICGVATPTTAPLFTATEQLFFDLGLKTTPVVALDVGDCIFMTDLPDFSPATEGSSYHLTEDNLAWRAGLNYTTSGGTLLYGTFSRGYKAGLIPNVAAVLISTDNPVSQEKLDAYELGIKAPLFDRRVNLNFGGFYYDYVDKQVQAKILDPVFGPIVIGRNVPKSRVWGLEGDVSIRAAEGLALNVAATYLEGKVTSDFFAANQAAVLANFKGSKLPFAPKFSLVGDAQYTLPVSDGLKAFVGGSVTHRSSTNATFENEESPSPLFDIKASTLVDVRAGLAADDDSWKVTVFGRNITNERYWNLVKVAADTTYRMAGRPLTYGVTVSVKTR